MTREEAIAKFSSLTREQQLAVLAEFGYEVTLDARGTYVPGGDGVEDPPQLRRCSEALHRVLSQMMHLLKGHKERYPDEVIISILWEVAPHHVQLALGHDS
jgi:hypothetical protein